MPEESEDDNKTVRVNLDDVAELLENVTTERIPEPITKTAPIPATPHVAKPRLAPKSGDERPLFERDMDELLGKTAVPKEVGRPKAAPVSGPDAMSLSEPARMFTLSASKATLLIAAVAILLALSFAAGYYLAPKG